MFIIKEPFQGTIPLTPLTPFCYRAHPEVSGFGSKGEPKLINMLKNTLQYTAKIEPKFVISPHPLMLKIFVYEK